MENEEDNNEPSPGKITDYKPEPTSVLDTIKSVKANIPKAMIKKTTTFVATPSKPSKSSNNIDGSSDEEYPDDIPAISLEEFVKRMYPSGQVPEEDMVLESTSTSRISKKKKKQQKRKQQKLQQQQSKQQHQKTPMETEERIKKAPVDLKNRKNRPLPDLNDIDLLGERPPCERVTKIKETDTEMIVKYKGHIINLPKKATKEELAYDYGENKYHLDRIADAMRKVCFVYDYCYYYYYYK